MPEPNESTPSTPWYAEVTRAQWLVLIIASAGWVFDVFEGQIFNITSTEMFKELLPAELSPEAVDSQTRLCRDRFLSIFLIGGTLGGVLFGTLADRLGRKPVMIVTILCYSIFSGLTFFATELWHVAVLRFVVAMGVGGEWAVAAALVAEVFPNRARAKASGIFHATSVLGTWMAAIAGLVVAEHWRYGYLIGVIPALLVLWVRSSVSEPERWQQAGTNEKTQSSKGSFRALFSDRRWRKSAILGILLAAVGLGTFWGVVIAGQELTMELLKKHDFPKDEAAQKAKFAYGIVQTLGGGFGLLSFGFFAERWGRKRTFVVSHLLAFAIVPITCYVPQTYPQMLAVLLLFGYFTLAMHAGYAIYFPELFPNHLRATGVGLCFNGGRLLAAPLLTFSAMLKARPDVDLRVSVIQLSFLYLAGAVIMLILPETKGQPLPE
ncbi:MAG: MFS transporter [Planctomycetota bacterium]|nr:MFS transporter [Planctomycetota bacterium]MDA1213239.1 MFS transporter [Planctomycetota bacterium]